MTFLMGKSVFILVNVHEFLPNNKCVHLKVYLIFLLFFFFFFFAIYFLVIRILDILLKKMYPALF